MKNGNKTEEETLEDFDWSHYLLGSLFLQQLTKGLSEF